MPRALVCILLPFCPSLGSESRETPPFGGICARLNGQEGIEIKASRNYEPNSCEMLILKDAGAVAATAGASRLLVFKICVPLHVWHDCRGEIGDLSFDVVPSHT